MRRCLFCFSESVFARVQVAEQEERGGELDIREEGGGVAHRASFFLCASTRCCATSHAASHIERGSVTHAEREIANGGGPSTTGMKGERVHMYEPAPRMRAGWTAVAVPLLTSFVFFVSSFHVSLRWSSLFYFPWRGPHHHHRTDAWTPPLLCGAQTHRLTAREKPTRCSRSRRRHTCVFGVRAWQTKLWRRCRRERKRKDR